MTVKELLIQARKRIDKPQKWISWWSQSDDGRRLGIDGAIWRTSGGDEALEKGAFRILAEYSGINPRWSDYDRVVYLCKHSEVMEMLNKAIESN